MAAVSAQVATSDESGFDQAQKKRSPEAPLLLNLKVRLSLGAQNFIIVVVVDCDEDAADHGCCSQNGENDATAGTFTAEFAFASDRSSTLDRNFCGDRSGSKGYGSSCCGEGTKLHNVGLLNQKKSINSATFLRS